MSLREIASRKEEQNKTKKSRRRRFTSRDSARIRRKGYNSERQLVKKLRGLNFKSVRIPASAPGAESLPDVFATKGEYILAFEVKSPKSNKVYFRRKQVAKLFHFLDMFEIYKNRFAVLVGKFRYKWVFRLVDDVDRNYVVKKEDENNIQIEQIGRSRFSKKNPTV